MRRKWSFHAYCVGYWRMPMLTTAQSLEYLTRGIENLSASEREELEFWLLLYPIAVSARELAARAAPNTNGQLPPGRIHGD